MGLFDVFRKKPQRPVSENFNPLDINSVITWYKRQNPKATEKDVLHFVSKLAEPDPDQEHLTSDGGLPWGWQYAHKDFTERISSEYRYFLNAWTESRKQSPRNEYAALKSFVMYMNDARRLCKSKGECYEYWLTICFDDDYLSKRTADLERLKQNLDELEATFQKKKEIEAKLPNLEKRLLEIIKKNSGILQKDIYKLFEPEEKNYVQERLYYAEKANIISREKSGNTYKLYITK